MPEDEIQKQPQTLGAKIDGLKALRDMRSELTKQVKVLTESMEGLEISILEALDADETTQSRGRTASATVTEQIVPSVTDWDAFYEWVKDTDSFYMLQRRVNAKPYEELLKSTGECIPGTEPFTKRTISLRSL